MAYNEIVAERIFHYFSSQNIPIEGKKMMGGLCFLLHDKMCCGIHFDKKSNQDLLMARIGEVAYADAIEKDECLPMDFTGRPMNGYVFVTYEGFKDDAKLAHWLNLCISFNPLAKASKKKK